MPSTYWVGLSEILQYHIVKFHSFCGLLHQHKMHHHHRQQALSNSGDHNGAIRSYDKALAIDANDVDALTSKGADLIRLGKYAEAIKYYDRALAIDPNPKDVGVLGNKGIALYHLGNYTGAIQYYDKALAIDAKNLDALNNKRLAIQKLKIHY